MNKGFVFGLFTFLIVLSSFVLAEEGSNAEEENSFEYKTCVNVFVVTPRVAAPNDQYKCEGREEFDLEEEVFIRFTGMNVNEDFLGLLVKNVEFDRKSILIKGESEESGIMLLGFDCNNDGLFEDAANVKINERYNFVNMRDFIAEGCSGDADLLIMSNTPDRIKISSVEVSDEVATSPICKDSDDGKNYFVRGWTIVTFGSNEDYVGTTHQDYCIGSDKLLEGFCDGNNLAKKTYTCPEGCSEGVCVGSNPSSNCQAPVCDGVGTFDTGKVDDRGCPIKRCYSVMEDVTCVFKNSKTTQWCTYMGGDVKSDDSVQKCEGIEKCGFGTSEGYGLKLKWKSSCGGYQYTIQDGNAETVTFDCSSGETKPEEVGETWFRNAYWQCSDGEEVKEGGESSCKPYGLWKKYATSFCSERETEVSAFSLSSICYPNSEEDPSNSEGETGSSCDEYVKLCKSGNEKSCILWENNCQDEDSLEVGVVCKDSCPSEGKCYPFGYRVSKKYCAISGDFVDQLGTGQSCENGFQCRSSVCAPDQCIDAGLLRRIIAFLTGG